MTVFDPYYIRYEAGHGQHAVLGSPRLVDDLEVIGAGLPKDGEWRNGGPFLVRRAGDAQTVLGWIRPMAIEVVGRQGAWESWGLVGPAGARTIVWPWLSAQLSRCAGDEDTLLEFAADLEERNTGDSSIPTQAALRLSSLFSDFLKAPQTPLEFHLHTFSDVDLLPWVWLLGPIKTETATLAPPRRSRAMVASPFSYVPLIVEPDRTPRTAEATYPFVETLVQRLAEDRDSALEELTDLRSAPLAEWPSRLSGDYRPPRIAGFAPIHSRGSSNSIASKNALSRPEQSKEEPINPMKKKSRPGRFDEEFRTPPNLPSTPMGPDGWQRALLRRLDVLIGLTGTILLLVAALLFERVYSVTQADRPFSRKDGRIEEQVATSDDSAPLHEQECGDNSIVGRRRILQGVKTTSAAVPFVKGISADSEWSWKDRERIRQAVRRIVLVRVCGSPNVGWQGGDVEDARIEQALTVCTAAPPLASFDEVVTYLCAETAPTADVTPP